MVRQMSFWGMRLRTRSQRRTLVASYYAVLMLVAAAGLIQIGFHDAWFMIYFTFWMALFLGGIYGWGPVKAYQRPILPLDMGGRSGALWDKQPERLLELGLSIDSANRVDRDSDDWTPLDERETAERDHAHYQAYRILRWSLGFAIVGYWLSLHWAYSWINGRLPTLTMVVLIYVLTLPQAILLWTEPDMDAG
jgi:hypothetical protein